MVKNGDIDNGQRIFVNIVAAQELCREAEKEGPLWDRVRRPYVEFRARNVARRGETDLQESLFDEPMLGGFFRYFSSVC